MNIRKRILSMLLILSSLTSLVACSQTQEEEKTSKPVEIAEMEAEESHGISFDLIGGKDVMPIAGYYGLYNAGYSYNGQNAPELATEEMMKAVADCGINLLESSNAGFTTDLLDWAVKYKVGLINSDGNIKRGQSLEQLNESLAKYRNHPGFCGLYLVDEPGGKTYFSQGGGGGLMEDWTEISQQLDELGLFTYKNLIKITGLSQREGYEQYIKEFCETMHPSHISYDYYPFDNDTKGDNVRYFWNMAVVREYAQKYEIPFWVFIQAGSQWNDGQSKFDSTDYVPTEGEMDWSVNCSLAFGAQGLQYFPLVQPYWFAYAQSTPFDFERNGIFGAWGNKNRWYYYAQDVNKQVAEVDDVLMNAVSKGVLASGKKAKSDTSDARDAMLDGTSWRELAGVHGDALVGCFNYQGKTALYVVNYDTQYAQDIVLDFHDIYNIRVSQQGATKYVKAEQLTLQMEAGDGALIVFE